MPISVAVAILITCTFAESGVCVRDPHSLQCREQPQVDDAMSLLQVRKTAEVLASKDEPAEVSNVLGGHAVPPPVPQQAAYSDPWVAFKFLEVNGDGFVDAKELAQSMVEEAEAGDVRGEKNTKPYSQAELDRLVADIDTNGDQKVSYKEFEDRWLADRETEIAKEGATAANLKTLLDSGSGAATSGTNSVGPEAPALPGLIQASEDARLRRARTEEAGEARWWYAPSPTLPPPPPKDPKAGNVAALYTYGAPATATKPLTNDNRMDGCFPGARVYTSSRVGGWFWGFYYKSDPVAWLATHNHVWPFTFLHAKMNILELKEWALGQPSLHRCSQKTTYWPERDYYYATSLHTLSPGPYETGVNNQQHYPTPRTVLHHAALAYLMGSAVNAKAAATARNVVATVVVGHDAAYLLQDPSNKECTLTFKGSDSLGIDTGDWINNVGNAVGVDFCGFEGVHKGFRTELLGLLQDPQWQSIKSKLPKCSALLATGHSLGGAQAELFSACANRAPSEGYSGHSDYQLLGWTWSTPEVIAA